MKEKRKRHSKGRSRSHSTRPKRSRTRSHSESREKSHSRSRTRTKSKERSPSLDYEVEQKQNSPIRKTGQVLNYIKEKVPSCNKSFVKAAIKSYCEKLEREGQVVNIVGAELEDKAIRFFRNELEENILKRRGCEPVFSKRKSFVKKDCVLEKKEESSVTRNFSLKKGVVERILPKYQKLIN